MSLGERSNADVGIRDSAVRHVKWLLLRSCCVPRRVQSRLSAASVEHCRGQSSNRAESEDRIQICGVCRVVRIAKHASMRRRLVDVGCSTASRRRRAPALASLDAAEVLLVALSSKRMSGPRFWMCPTA